MYELHVIGMLLMPGSDPVLDQCEISKTREKAMITTQNSINMMTNAKKEEIRQMAAQIYIQRTRLPIPEEDLPELVQACFREAEIFIQQADKIQTVNIEADAWQKIIDLVKIGSKINAIKDYRALTGVGLKEAKDIIDKLNDQINSPSIVATPLPARPTPINGLQQYDSAGNPIMLFNQARQIPGGILVTNQPHESI